MARRLVNLKPGDTKVCADCGETKSVSDFYTAGAYLGAYCKPCTCIRTATYKKAHPEQAKAAGRKYRFKITPAEYAARLNAQGGVCASCHAPETRETNGTLWALSVDHDHACCAGKRSCGGCIRGLVCDRCNKVLGMVDDNPEVLMALLEYLAGSSTPLVDPITDYLGQQDTPDRMLF